ncbi:MAG: hypothetical protein QMC78_04945 [Methanocellales archaeon]|nr:hypothetical protein [Methanocellales archaeon]
MKYTEEFGDVTAGFCSPACEHRWSQSFERHRIDVTSDFSDVRVSG